MPTGSWKRLFFLKTSSTETGSRRKKIRISPFAEDESFGPNKEVEASTTLKRAPLTARERLRAARVVSRYTTESTKPSSSSAKMGLGGSSKLPELLQDKGRRRPGLPEAPSDLLDDSDRALLPKQGWSINIIPGGMDVFLIIFSFVFISTVMFATTYIVWKVGAIHFNEY
ncbi:hypothetical protein M569_06946 [Genlisea aurea]|uniref:Transmembrane protein n=1 Tax=Genlisea aurea TaxID=192259 RepID=S8CMA7_9LAMI|nr:hypothetical protein M569_06946 [Genlisea aurea]